MFMCLKKKKKEKEKEKITFWCCSLHSALTIDDDQSTKTTYKGILLFWLSVSRLTERIINTHTPAHTHER